MFGMIPALAVATMAVLSVIATFTGVMRYLEPDFSLDERLASNLSRSDRPTADVQQEKALSSLITRLDQFIARQDFTEQLTQELLQADLRLKVSEYLLMRAAAVGAGFLLGMVTTHTPIAGALLAIAGFFAPPLYLRYRQQKRLEAFESQLGDVLTLLIGALRAGYGFVHALNVVMDEIPPPASDEFRRVVREVGLGLTVQEALNNLVRRVNSKDLDMMVTAISIQQEVGGNLANILEVISETIRERVRIQGEIRVLTTQQKVTGYLLAFLPFILGTVLFMMNPTYMRGLFTPGITLVIPIGATIGVAIGFLIIRHIVDIKV